MERDLYDRILDTLKQWAGEQKEPINPDDMKSDIDEAVETFWQDHKPG